jgi:hypothetical protein
MRYIVRATGRSQTAREWEHAPGAAKNASTKTVDLAQNLEVYCV